jgi:hypothetical protein
MTTIIETAVPVGACIGNPSISAMIGEELLITCLIGDRWLESVG